jgi:hypothetical protein
MTHIDIGGKIQPINIEVKNFQAHYCSLEETTNEKPWYPASRISFRSLQDG